ncbi:MAG TPA: biopolymer transporter ExbD [Terriglobia bacterium]|nr:biopolymer transporter ExbD [Terriglobia bacterium]
MAFTSNKGTTQTSLSEINVTPLVDVVLVLLVIFMLTAPILQSGIEVTLPKTHTVRLVKSEKVVVTLDKEQTIYVGNDPVNIHQLGSIVGKKLGGDPNSPVYIRADEAVPFGAFAGVMDVLKQAGITNVSIVTTPLRTKRQE